MRRSSAYKVQYEVRPSKQTERRLILDILRTAAETGIKLDGCQYIGFGGVRFYDFEMIYRHLGIRDMVSIELDETLAERCKFNKPFGFISFNEGKLTDYLERTTFEKPIIGWFDYDCVLNGDVVGDMKLIGSAVPVGSFVFVTIDARLPPGLENKDANDRLAIIKEEYGEFALAQDGSELSKESFPWFAERVLWSSLSEALKKRGDGEFLPLMRVFYKHTTLMMTVGGCFCPKGRTEALRKRLYRDFRFLLPGKEGKPYIIPAFNLTPKERQLLDGAVTGDESTLRIRKKLRKLGFNTTEISDYKRMVRFLPKYVEAYI